MGMFDEVRVINIRHKNFKEEHNDTVFQTKDIENDLSFYTVFNGHLYQDVDNRNGRHLRHEYAKPVDHSGVITIYTNIRSGHIESWVEYNLIFEAGNLIDVELVQSRVTKDHRDLYSERPSAPSNRVTITISVGDCDNEKKESFARSLDASKIDAIRQILGEPKSTVYYPVLQENKPHQLFNANGGVRMIASVVQAKEDFISATDSNARIKAPNGDEIKIILDEASAYCNAKQANKCAGG